MSSVEPSGNRRPLRLAGFALLGLAAVALIGGIISTASSGPESSANPPPTPPPAVSSAPPPANSATTKPPATKPATPTDPGASPPGLPTGGATPPGVDTSRLVRVYNNSKIMGLAARAANDLRAADWEVAEFGNYPDGRLAVTTVYFRPGTSEEGPARELAGQLGARVEPRFPGIAPASPGLIVILTKDYSGVHTK